MGTSGQPFVEILVRNLDDSYNTEDKVRQLFQTFGTISAVKLVKNSDGHSIGMAYITFTQPSMAAKACRSEYGMINSFGKRMIVERAVTKKQR